MFSAQVEKDLRRLTKSSLSRIFLNPFRDHQAIELGDMGAGGTGGMDHRDLSLIPQLEIHFRILTFRIHHDLKGIMTTDRAGEIRHHIFKESYSIVKMDHALSSSCLGAVKR